MSGWQVLGWACIASLSIIVVGFGVTFATVMFRFAVPVHRPGTTIYKGDPR